MSWMIFWNQILFKLYRKVLDDEETLVKAGGMAQFGYLPRMVLANIGAMNAESFCERALSSVCKFDCFGFAD